LRRGISLGAVTAPLVFGVFPLGLAGGPDGVAAGPPDDFEAIGRAFEELQGQGRAHRFGVLRSDYSPKPAFHKLRRLIAELG
jgi:hypothetical protein